MAKPKIGIVVGSTRPNRFADKPTEWIEKIATRPRRYRRRSPRPARLSDAVLRRGDVAGLGAVAERGRAEVAEEGRRARRLHLHRRRIQSRPDGGAEERDRLRLQRVEQEGRDLRRLWRRRRGACGRAAPPAMPSSCRWRRRARPSTSCCRTSSPCCSRARSSRSSTISTRAPQQMLDQLVWWTKALKAARDSDAQTAEIKAA